MDLTVSHTYCLTLKLNIRINYSVIYKHTLNKTNTIYHYKRNQNNLQSELFPLFIFCFVNVKRRIEKISYSQSSEVLPVNYLFCGINHKTQWDSTKGGETPVRGLILFVLTFVFTMTTGLSPSSVTFSTHSLKRGEDPAFMSQCCLWITLWHFTRSK